jgi:hypothetical protein
MIAGEDDALKQVSPHAKIVVLQIDQFSSGCGDPLPSCFEHSKA